MTGIPRDLRHEPRWPAAIALVLAIVLYLLLPQSLIVGPKWVLPVIEGVLLLVLIIANPDRSDPDSRMLRALSIALIAVLSIAIITALGLLVRDLLDERDIEGKRLIYAAVALWWTSVIVYALWYWELDGGGPARRHDLPERRRDFLFPQQATPEVFSDPWMPSFLDYLYVSFTNSTAFSPTDSMPLSARAKSLMMLQSASALVTIALVAARAVNILA